MTTSLEARCLESFPSWIEALAQDARALAELLQGESTEGSRRWAALSLTYLVRSLDWTDKGLEELGLFEDACVLRAASALLPLEERPVEVTAMLSRFATELALLIEFLGPEDAARLEQYVQRLALREPGVEALLADPEATAALVENVRRWAEPYAPSVLLRDAKDLLKLRAFLSTRLASNVTAA